jgi:hypothetical protein
VFGLTYGLPAAAGAQTAAPVEPTIFPSSAREEFQVGRAESSIRVDGSLDEAAWASAMRWSLPFETSPGNNTAARVETLCYVTYDDANLYLACEALDPDPTGIRAFITDRDDVDGHDRVGFTIDPFNDARRAFEFGVTALGVQSDGVFDQQQGWTDLSWDAIWSSAGRITNRGYMVEAAIPFRSLRFPSGAGIKTWGIFAWRQWPRSESVETRSMQLDRNNSCMLCQANLATGFQGISPGVNLELVPTVTSSRTDSRDEFPTDPLARGSLDAEPGLDLRWGITSDLTLNTTVNPDFSQVEADVAQLDVNNRFALFFPEKRPFFLEGADFFGTPLRAVFTRTITDPILGTKLTGKMGANAMGTIVARDRTSNFVFPGNQGSSSASLEQDMTTVLARFRRDVGASSTLGVLYTGRESDAYYNRVGGVDGFFRPWNPLTVQLQYLRAATDYPDSLGEESDQVTGGFGGDAFTARVKYSTRNWLFQAIYQSLDPGFRADAGFINQVDIRRFNVWGQRKFWGRPGGGFSQIDLNGGWWRDENLDGRLTMEGLWGNVYFEGPLQTFFWINPDRVHEYFEGQIFPQTRLWTGWGIRPSGNLGVNLQFVTGDAIDFANARKAFRLELSPSVDLRLGRHIDVRLSHRLQRLSSEGTEIFTANLSQIRTVYNFNPRTFVRAIIQLRYTDRNPEVHEDEVNREEQNLFSQLLFSYKVNPQTVFFLGYTDTRLGSTAEDFQTIPLTQSSRTFFMKLGYAWRP